MLLRQAPVVETVVGLDSARGWLPNEAAMPLPEAPLPAVLDVRIVQENGKTKLCWRPHNRHLAQLPSACNSRSHASLFDALRDARELFELDDSDWLFSGGGQAPTLNDVIMIRDATLTAHGVDLLLPFEGMNIVAPRLARFLVPNGPEVDLWVVLEGGSDGYVIFFDPEEGTCGIGTQGGGGLTYIGDYGCLWETIESL